MFVPGKESLPDFVMRVGRRRDRSGVHHPGKFFERLRDRNIEFFSDTSGPGKIDIVNGGELDRGNSGIEPRVIAPDMADADNTDAQFVRVHVGLFCKNQS